MPRTSSGQEKDIGYSTEKQILENSMKAKKSPSLRKAGEEVAVVGRYPLTRASQTRTALGSSHPRVRRSHSGSLKWIRVGVRHHTHWQVLHFGAFSFSFPTRDLVVKHLPVHHREAKNPMFANVCPLVKPTRNTPAAITNSRS